MNVDQYDDEDELIDAAESAVESMAEEHHDACYDGAICGACTEDTPISGQWGPWMGMMNEFDSFVGEVESRVQQLGGDPIYIQPHLGGIYLETFREAAADPEDCVVCNREVIEVKDECGHERYGEECPVT